MCLSLLPAPTKCTVEGGVHNILLRSHLMTEAVAAAADDRPAPRAIVLDCGSVTNPDCGHGNEAVAAAMGVSPEDARKGHKAAWKLAKKDPTFTSYWSHAFEVAGVPEADRTVERAAACEAALGAALSQTYNDTLETVLLAKAAAAESGSLLVIGMISNHITAPPLFEYCAQGARLHELVTAPSLLVVSQSVGLAKPDPAIFRLWRERLTVLGPPFSEISVQECLFLDDKPENVAAAVAEGWQSDVYNASHAVPGALAALLRSRGVALLAPT